MLNLMKKISLTAVLMILIGTVAVTAQDYQRDGDDSYYYERSNIDRYLDVEVWTDHSDAEYIEGDNIVIYFRSNRDAFVSIYSIDTRGMVNLMYPSDPAQDNFVRGGVTYSLPGPDDDFDLEINGPDGIENIQIIASRERFTIPDWYNNSGLVCTDDDRHDYMDYLNERYFVRYDGQRFAYDRAVIFVEEWEPTYFRPVYYPDYPNWAIVGNVYVDYAWGSSVYINGYYWGVTPLYVPRLLVGWHTMTIYDHYGYCWESDFHCSRYNTVVFDRTSIRPRSEIVSKFKEVRAVGYRNPVSHGYPKYKESIIVKKAIRSGLATTPAGVTKDVKVKVKSLTTTEFKTSTKKHIRGSSKVVKTERGYQSTALGKSKKSGSSRYSGSKSSSKKSSSSGTSRYGKSSTSSKKSSGSSSKSSSVKSGSSKSGSSSSGYYQKKSGSSSGKSSSTKAVQPKSSKSPSSSKGKVSSGSKSSSSKSSSSKSSSSTKSVKSSSGSKSSTPKATTSSKKSSSSSGGKKKR